MAESLERLGVKLPEHVAPLRSPGANENARASSPAPAAANDNLPLHETKPIAGNGPDAYTGPAELPPRSEGGHPTPLVPETQQTIGPDGEPVPNAKAPITPEEAKTFALLVVQYFQFGSSQLFLKHPEFVEGMIAMAGSPDAFNQQFAFFSSFVGQSAEHCAMKYNLRIPYLQEAVVVGAIGIATFGLAGKPSERGKQNLAAMARGPANAKNANPSAAASSAPADAAPAAADTVFNAAGKPERVDPDEGLWR